MPDPLVIGPLLLRLSGKYFVLVTFMVGEVIRLTFTQWSSLTGGANGLFGIPVPFKWLDSLLHIYYFMLLVSALCVGLVVRIMTSELGRAIDSIREAQRVSECSGVPAIRMKVRGTASKLGYSCSAPPEFAFGVLKADEIAEWCHVGNVQQLWFPPVWSKTSCDKRSFSGNWWINSLLIPMRFVSSGLTPVASASIEDLPQTPQLEVV